MAPHAQGRKMSPTRFCSLSEFRTSSMATAALEVRCEQRKGADQEGGERDLVWLATARDRVD